MTTVPTPAFRRMADMVSQDLVLVPLVEAYLRARKFPKVFSVTFRDEGKARMPDGFFHPSSHPLLPERVLYYYLTEPDAWIPEELEYENWMAVMMGTAAHSLVQTCMTDAGLLLKPIGTCMACGRPHGKRKNDCDEFGVLDKVLGRRGHMDGILEIGTNDWGRGLFEFKTINPKACYGLEHHALEWLKTKKKVYYAQFQEYLDMTGMAKGIIMFCIPTFPFRLVEIEVPYDPIFMTQQKAKYERVRHAEATGEIPDACCGPLSKDAKACPARTVCPIGKIR